MDFAAVDRSILVHNGRSHIQTGVMIEADTDPSDAYDHCRDEAKELFAAIARSQSGFERVVL